MATYAVDPSLCDEFIITVSIIVVIFLLIEQCRLRAIFVIGTLVPIYVITDGTTARHKAVRGGYRNW